MRPPPRTPTNPYATDLSEATLLHHYGGFISFFFMLPPGPLSCFDRYHKLPLTAVPYDLGGGCPRAHLGALLVGLLVPGEEGPVLRQGPRRPQESRRPETQVNSPLLHDRRARLRAYDSTIIGTCLDEQTDGFCFCAVVRCAARLSKAPLQQVVTPARVVPFMGLLAPGADFVAAVART